MGWPASLKSSNSKNCLVLYLSPQVSWDSELSFPSVVEGWSYNMLMSSLTVCLCGVQPFSNQMVYEAPRYTGLTNTSLIFFCVCLTLLLTLCCIGRNAKMFCGLCASGGNTFYRNKDNPRFCERLPQTLSKYCAGYLLPVHIW